MPPKTAQQTSSVGTAGDQLRPAGVRGVTAAEWRSESKKTTRAAYLPASTIGRTGLGVVESFLRTLQATEINTIVVDIKEVDGAILFDVSRVKGDTDGWDDSLEASLRKNTADSPADLRAIVDAIHRRGMKAVVRQVLFKDAALARTNPEAAIQDKMTQEPWGNSKTWISPWNKDAQTYNIGIARRALAAGADEIQFDHTRFPDLGEGDLTTAHFPDNVNNRENADAIVSFLARAREEIRSRFPDRKIGADVFGSVAAGTNKRDALGQDVAEMAKYLDVIWPMQYPSHWARQGKKAFGTGHPETIPRKIYEATTRRLIDQIGERAHDVEIRPWVQAFEIASFGGVRMEQPRRGELGSYVLKQRAGLMSGGANGYALWGRSPHRGKCSRFSAFPCAVRATKAGRLKAPELKSQVERERGGDCASPVAPRQGPHVARQAWRRKSSASSTQSRISNPAAERRKRTQSPQG